MNTKRQMVECPSCGYVTVTKATAVVRCTRCEVSIRLEDFIDKRSKENRKK